MASYDDASTSHQSLVPGLLYVIGNNLHYQILRYLTPTSFKVLEQVKIIITAGFMRLLLGTRLRARQWVAAGGSLRTGTRTTLNPLLMLCACV
jgi:hypothetical protein